MKTVGFTSIAVFSLILAATAPAFARQEQRQGEKQDRPEQQEHQGKQEQAKPAQQHAQQKPQAAQKPKPQQAKQQKAPNQGHPQQAKQQPKQNRPQQAKAPHRAPQAQHAQQAAWTQHRTASWQTSHRTWQQRGGYNGYRIPQDRFGGYFGPDHGFRINGLPFQTVGGYPRFQYQGYWLSLVDPWPSNWSNNWYDTDNVYVSYDNGYYLYDTRYPGVGLAISVSN